MIEILISVLLYGIAAGFIGWKLREIVALRHLSKLQSHVDQQWKDALDKSCIPIKIEIDKDGVIFVYDRITNEYMAHSSDRQTLERQLNIKYPNKIFTLSDEDMSSLPPIK